MFGMDKIKALKVNSLFAVHNNVEFKEKYTVTHLPTGYAVDYKFDTEEIAKDCAKMVYPQVKNIELVYSKDAIIAAKAFHRDLIRKIKGYSL